MGIFSRKPNLQKLAKRQDIEGLVKIIKSQNQDNETRQRAAFVLGELGPAVARPAIPELTAALRDNDEGVRGISAFALGRILDRGNIRYYISIKSEPIIDEEPAVDALVNMLNEKERDIRKTVAIALGLTGRPQLTVRLLDTLQTEEDSQVRGAILISLAMIGDPVSVLSLIDCLKEDDPIVRDSAASGLERFGRSNLLHAATADIFTKNDTEHDRLAWMAIGKIEAEGAMNTLIKAMKNSNPDIRLKSVQALNMMCPNIEEAMPSLIEALEDGDQRVRKTAASALGGIGPNAEAAIPNLVGLLGAIDRGVRSSASDALSHIGGTSVINALIATMQDEALREGAIETLGLIGPEAILGLSHVISALNDKSEFVRRSVVNTLMRIGSNDAVPALVSALEDKDTIVRQKAAEALGELGDESVVPALKELLKDENNDVRIHAHAATARISNQPREHINFLVDVLKNRKPGNPQIASEVLAKIGPPAKYVVPALYDCLSTKNEILRQAILDAIRKITGKEQIVYTIGSDTHIDGPPVKFTLE